MVWTGAYSTFAVETFFKTSESIIVIQKTFRAHFILRRKDAVPDRKSILLLSCKWY